MAIELRVGRAWGRDWGTWCVCSFGHLVAAISVFLNSGGTLPSTLPRFAALGPTTFHSRALGNSLDALRETVRKSRTAAIK